MTLRSLFFKLQREDIKRRMWAAALSMLVFFLFGPVYLALTLEGYTGNLNEKYIISHVISTIGPGFILQYMITIAAALICACSGYFFLHSRKKVDFFHSMPVRRELLFFVNYVDGILVYFLPYLISMLFNFLVLLVGGHLQPDVLAAGFQGIGTNLLYFLLIYTLTVVAVMLTGNGIVSILGTGVFLAYGPLIMSVEDLYSREFFKTYLSDKNDSYFLTFLSPVGKYIKRSQMIVTGDYTGLGASIALTLTVIIMLLLFSVFLYKKRSSEAAGKAMAFVLAKPIIKFLIIIPVALFGGWLFRGAASVHSDGWMIFGLLLIFLIAAAIIEIIYQFDLKKAFAHKKGLAAAALVTAAVVCIFRFDLFSYDNYLPDKDKIASMSVSIPGLDSDKISIEVNEGATGYTYNSSFEHEAKYMRIKDFGAAYEIAKLGIKGLGQKDESGDKYYSCTVAFHLKNKKTVLRNYTIVPDEDYTLLKQVYESSEFKEGYYPIYRWKSNYITAVSAFNSKGSTDFTLTAAQREELLEIYKDELKTLTIDQIISSRPLAALRFTLFDDRTFDYDIFPEFTKTIEFLSAHGFDAGYQLKAEDIKKVTVVKQPEEKDVVYSEKQYTSDKLYVEQVEYVKKEQIEEILQAALPGDYCSEFSRVLNPNYDLMVNIVWNTDTFGNENTQTFYFTKDNIPAFVLKDLDYNPAR